MRYICEECTQVGDESKPTMTDTGWICQQCYHKYKETDDA